MHGPLNVWVAFTGKKKHSFFDCGQLKKAKNLAIKEITISFVEDVKYTYCRFYYKVLKKAKIIKKNFSKSLKNVLTFQICHERILLNLCFLAINDSGGLLNFGLSTG